MQPALLLLELDSIAVGIEVGDAMAKRAALSVLLAGTVQPGKYLVLAGGEVGDVDEAHDAGRRVGADHLIDELYLPDVHSEVVAGLVGGRTPGSGEALGVVEMSTAASVLAVADAAVKGASVTIREIRLADGLGGKGYVLFDGTVGEVEAAVEIGVAASPTNALASRVIAQLHPEMEDNLAADGRFAGRVRKQ